MRFQLKHAALALLALITGGLLSISGAIGPHIGPHVGPRIGPRIGASPSGSLVLLGGDSNTTGIGVGDSADTGFAVGTPITTTPYNRHYAVGVGPPPTFVDFPSANTFGSLGLYAASSTQSLGMELTLGPALVAGGLPSPAIALMSVSGSTLAVEWLPTGTYPAAGAGNLFNLFVAYAKGIAGGRSIPVSVWNLGTNDALDAGQANAFQTNMGAFATALRAAFGANHVIVWVKTNVNTGNAFTSTVRAKQVAYAATDSLFYLVDDDDLSLLGDGLHFLTNGYLTLGQRAAAGALSKLGYAAQTVTGAPSVLGYGPESHGSSSPLSVVSWGGERDGDLQLLHVNLGIVAGSITTPAGWTLVDTVSSTAAGVTEQTAVYTRAVTTALLNANGGHMPAASVAFATAARAAAKTYTVRGPNANPTVDTSAFTGPNTFDTGPTAHTGVTTTAASELVAVFSGGYCGSSGTMSATSTLTGFRQIQDTATVIVTDREIMDLWTGTQAAAGATGNVSVSSSANMAKLGAVIGVKP